MRRQPHLLPMRLELRVPKDAPHGRVAYLEMLITQMLTEQRARPVRDQDAYVGRLSTSFGNDSCAVGVRERDGGRPDRWASGSREVGLGPLNRRRSRHTVLGWMPSNLAISTPGTSSAMRSTACARSTTRRSAFAGRHAASKIARASADNLIGAARRPGCGHLWRVVGNGIRSRSRVGVRHHGGRNDGPLGESTYTLAVLDSHVCRSRLTALLHLGRRAEPLPRARARDPTGQGSFDFDAA